MTDKIIINFYNPNTQVSGTKYRFPATTHNDNRWPFRFVLRRRMVRRMRLLDQVVVDDDGEAGIQLSFKLKKASGEYFGVTTFVVIGDGDEVQASSSDKDNVLYQFPL